MHDYVGIERAHDAVVQEVKALEARTTRDQQETGRRIRDQVMHSLDQIRVLPTGPRDWVQVAEDIDYSDGSIETGTETHFRLSTRQFEVYSIRSYPGARPPLAVEEVPVTDWIKYGPKILRGVNKALGHRDQGGHRHIT